MRSAKAAIVGAAILVAAVYVVAAPREAVFGDGLEFMAAAACRGVPHPTGYPLLMVLLAPLAKGPHAYFLGVLLNALLATGAAALAGCLAWKLPPAAEAPRSPIGAALVTLFVGLSAGLWSAASVVEVYALNALLILALLALLLPGPEHPIGSRRLFAGGLLLGLAACNHLTSLALGAILLWRVLKGSALANVRAWFPRAAASFAGFFLGILPYLAIPLRAAQDPAVNWGDADDPQGFAWLLSGGEYRETQFLQSSPGRFFTFGQWLAFAGWRLIVLIMNLGGQFLGQPRSGAAAWLAGALGLALLALAGLGLRALWRRNRWAAVALAVAALAQVGHVLAYNIADIEDYFLGVWATLLPAFLLGAAAFAETLLRRGGFTRREGRLRAALAVFAVLAALSNLKAATRPALADLWIDRTLEPLEPNAIILTWGDYDSYALWYAQQSRALAPGVAVIATNFLRFAWYESMLPHHPDATFTVEATDFRRLTAESFTALMDRCAIAPNIGAVPLYTTEGDPVVLRILARRYELKPVAALLSEEELEALLDTHPALPPQMLFRLEPR